MVKLSYIIGFILCLTFSYAQDINKAFISANHNTSYIQNCNRSAFYVARSVPFVRKGLLKATGTISPSLMLNHKINNIYLSGELEYFLENKISVRGDGLLYMDSN